MSCIVLVTSTQVKVNLGSEEDFCGVMFKLKHPLRFTKPALSFTKSRPCDILCDIHGGAGNRPPIQRARAGLSLENKGGVNT
jgi:hypothetical protein